MTLAVNKFKWAVAGALSGYLILHPLIMIISHCMSEYHAFTTDAFFGMISYSIHNSFSVSMLPWGLAFSVFTASILLYRTILREKKMEKSKLMDQLYQTQKMETIGKFAGGIAHDFNNLLTAIINNVYLLKTKLKTIDPLMNYVDKIMLLSNKAAQIINKLLVFSKREINEIRFLNLNDIIINEEGLLKALLREDIELMVELSDKNPSILGDSTMIEEVLMNLVTNARDAMPNGGTITIQTDIDQIKDLRFIKLHGGDEPGRFALISVTDTGSGMDNEVSNRLFEPFFSTKKPGKGIGLGLSMVYTIVKQHNGFIDTNSQLGKGTTFMIYIPIAEASKKKRNMKH